MDAVAKAYLAGLLDGEGCIRIERFATDRSPIGVQFRTIVEISMCDYTTMSWVAKATGRHIQKSTRATKRGRKVYKLVWRNGHARDLLRELYPYLLGKAREAEVALHFEDHVTPGRGRTYAVDDEERCEALRQRLVSLKQSEAERC